MSEPPRRRAEDSDPARFRTVLARQYSGPWATLARWLAGPSGLPGPLARWLARREDRWLARYARTGTRPPERWRVPTDPV